MRITRALIAGMCAVLLLSCGNNNEREGTQPDAQPSQNIVQVGLTEYAFGMPEQVTGGTVTFAAKNTGGLPHEMAFGAIEGDRTIDDFMTALQKGGPPKWMTDLAGIPVLSSGVSASMTRDLDQGQYVFLCFLPTPQGEPHSVEGMVKLFTVSGNSGAESPQADYTITATDEGFDVPEISAGTHTIELVNDGTKPHEFAFIAFEPGAGEKDLNQWFGGGFKGDPPALFPGGLQAIDPGTAVIVEMTFEEGRTYTLQDFENKLEAKITV